MKPLAKDPGWTLSARRGEFGTRGGDFDDRRPNANVEDSLRGISRIRGRDPLSTKQDENAMPRRMAAIIGHIDPPLSNLEALLLFRPPRERLRRTEISKFASSIMEDILET